MKAFHPMRIAMLLGDFESGGGQIAALRLANSLSAKHRVYLVNARPWLRCDFAQGDFHEELSLVDLSEVNQCDMASSLAEFFVEEGVELIHSHIWWADRLAIEVRRYCDIPWVSTLHGCQEFLLSSPSADQNFWTGLREFISYVDGIVYLSAKNLSALSKFELPPFTVVRQIYNGLPAGDRVPEVSKNRGVLKFVLASRAIVEKGWDTALVAVSKIERIYPGKVHLSLVGDGPFLNPCKELANRLGVTQRVTFHGYSSNPMSIMRECDVGILPTRFVSESLPNCVVEYMASGLAVIASPIGEVENMILAGPRPAGFSIEMIDNKPDVDDLVCKMTRYILEEDLLRCHSWNAEYRFRNLFAIELAASSYEQVYSEAIMAFTPPNLRDIRAATPLFREDRAALRSSRSSSGQLSSTFPINSVARTVFPTLVAYSERGLVQYSSDLKALSIHAHPLGPVQVYLGPYRFMAGGNTVRITVASLDGNARPFEVSLSAVDTVDDVSDDGALSACRISFEGVGIESVTLEAGNLSDFYVLCTVRMLDGSAASYSAASVLTVVSDPDRVLVS